MFEKFIFWKCLKQLIAEIFTCKSKAAVAIKKTRLWSGSAMSQLAMWPWAEPEPQVFPDIMEMVVPPKATDRDQKRDAWEGSKRCK